MKSFTNQFISDLYGSILHVETSSLSGLSSVASVYDGLGNQTSFSVGLVVMKTPKLFLWLLKKY